MGQTVRPDDGGEARWSRPQPTATSHRPVRCHRAHRRSHDPPTSARALGGPARSLPMPATRRGPPAPSPGSPRVQATSTHGAARVGIGPTLLAAAARDGAPLPHAAPTHGPPGDFPARRLRPAGPPARRCREPAPGAGAHGPLTARGRHAGSAPRPDSTPEPPAGAPA